MEEKFKMENLAKLKKKIFLIIGSDFYLSLERSYLRAFKNLKINNVDFFSPDKKLTLDILSRFNNPAIKKIYFLMYRKAVKNFISKGKKYDYIIIFKGLQLDLACLNTYKEYQISAEWINIYTDNPFNLEFASCSNHEVLNSVKLIENTIRQTKDAYNLSFKDCFLMGFSQGGMMTFECGRNFSNRLGGLAILSGRIMYEDLEINQSLVKTPLFISHGDQDEVLPIKAFYAACSYLKEQKLDYEQHVLKGDTHIISPEAIKLLQKFIKKNL